MTTFKFCPHRESLENSMKELKEFSSKEEFLEYLKSLPFIVVSENTLECVQQNKDPQIDWDEVWFIKDTIGVIGYTSKNIQLFDPEGLSKKGLRVRQAFMNAHLPSAEGLSGEEKIKRINYLKNLTDECKTYVQKNSLTQCILEMDKLLTDGEKDKFFYIGLLFFQKLKQIHKLNSGEINSPDFNPANYV